MRCKSLSPRAHLVVINDQDENKAIAAMITYKYGNFKFHAYIIVLSNKRTNPALKLPEFCHHLIPKMYRGLNPPSREMGSK